MNRKGRKLTATLVLSLLVGSTWAQQATQQNDVQQTAGKDSSVTNTSTAMSREALASHWGLTAKEWERFETLKQGPRGYWSPSLDPLTALGMEAQSDAERQRYAELQVKMEVARVEKELAYQRAYNQAFQRLYPEMLPVQGMAVDDTGLRMSPTVSSQGHRQLLFVKPGCAPCDRRARKLQDAGTAFDVYVIGSAGKDEAIRSWAKKVGIKPTLVQSGQITLNHDNGLWQNAFGGYGEIPATFQRVGAQWQRVD